MPVKQGLCAVLKIIAAPFRSLVAFFRAVPKSVRVLRRLSVDEIHFSTLTVNGISYYGLNGAEGKVIRLASVKLILHIPTLHDPYFVTICAKGIRHFGPLGSAHCNLLSLRIRMPRRDQTWVRVCIDDIQATVRGSVPPHVIDILREDLLRAVLLGQIVRLDDFLMAADTSMIWTGQGVCTVAEATEYEIIIAERTYHFQRANFVLRRDWDRKYGRLLITADGVTWYKTSVNETAKSSDLRFLDFLCYPATIIPSIVDAVERPATLYDLVLAHGELKFPKFRHRDQPILKHALQFTGETNLDLMPGFTERFLWSAIGGILDIFNAHLDSDYSNSYSEADLLADEIVESTSD